MGAKDLQMAINVHSLVENTHHLNSAIGCAMKDRMPTDAPLSIALANRIA